MESVEQLNNRLKALKQALLMEKDTRKEKNKAIDQVKTKIRELDETSAAVVKTIQDLVIQRKSKEKTDAEEELLKSQDSLKIAKARANPLKKSFGSSKSILALQAQNEKLMEEYSGLKSEHRMDETYINKLKEEYSQYIKELQSKNLEIRKINESCSFIQEESLLKTQALRDQIQETLQTKIKVLEKNAEITEELEKQQRKSLRLSQDLLNLHSFISAKKDFENQLFSSVKSHELNEAYLASQLMEAKSVLLDAQSFYQEFQVKIIKLLIPISGKLIFKKSEEDEYVLELLYANKVDSILIKDIDDITDHSTKETRFFIKVHNKSKEIMTDQKKKILPRMRELMQRCIKVE